MSAYLIEYSLLGAVAVIAVIALGAAGASPMVAQVFKAHWRLDWGGIILLLAGATSLAGLGGGIAALDALSQRPAPVLSAP